MPLMTNGDRPIGEMFVPPDVDAAREFFRQKSRAMVDKLMGVPQAVEHFIQNGDYIAVGGFGSVRLPTAILHEIVRQKRKNLGFAGHCSTHDFQILAAGRTIDRCDISYIVGLELRGLSPNGRRQMEAGLIRSTEWSNAGLGWRYKAAAMGLPYLPTRTMLGSDTALHSSAKQITCPFTGMKLLAIPALFPDVGIIHVHQADIYGNARIDGITIVDEDLARASKRLMITAERIVDTEEFRQNPGLTTIPYWLTDAVCHVPYGSYPGEMPYEYTSDEMQMAEWLEAERSDETLDAFVQKYIFGTPDFDAYLALSGGLERMPELQKQEPLKRPQERNEAV